MRSPKLTSAAVSLVAVASIALVAGEARAQRRRPTQPEPTAAPTVAPTAAPTVAPTAAPAPPPAQPSAFAPVQGGRNNQETLISGAINRPGFHATRANFEIFGGVGPGAWAWPWGGLVTTVGLRVGIPLTRNGPVAHLNNDMRLMIGAMGHASVTPDLYFWAAATLSLQWNFYLSDQWSVLLEGGLTADVFIYDYLNCYDHPRLYCDRVYFHPAGAFGLRRHLTNASFPGFPSVAFRFTYPAGVQVALEL